MLKPICDALQELVFISAVSADFEHEVRVFSGIATHDCDRHEMDVVATQGVPDRAPGSQLRNKFRKCFIDGICPIQWKGDRAGHHDLLEARLLALRRCLSDKDFRHGPLPLMPSRLATPTQALWPEPAIHVL